MFFRGPYYKNLFGSRISPRGAVPAKLLKHSSRVMFAARERSAAALRPDDYRSELIRVRRRPGFRTELPGAAGETESAHGFPSARRTPSTITDPAVSPSVGFRGISTATVPLLRRVNVHERESYVRRLKVVMLKKKL